jgi:hypothetical protein
MAIFAPRRIRRLIHRNHLAKGRHTDSGPRCLVAPCPRQASAARRALSLVRASRRRKVNTDPLRGFTPSTTPAFLLKEALRPPRVVWDHARAAPA